MSALLRGEIAWAAMAVLALCGKAWGEDLEKDFLVARFTTEDGLPLNTVHGIEQTPDGYLWLATYNGLARFDGVRFKVFNNANTPAMVTSSLAQLHCDARGWLWMVDDHWSVSAWNGERFSRYSGNGLPNLQMELEGEAPNAQMHFRALGKEIYFQFDGQSFTPSGLDNGDPDMRNLHADRRGHVWSVVEGEWRSWSHAPFGEWMPNPDDEIIITRPARENAIWIGSAHGLYHFKDGQVDRFYPSPETIGNCTGMIEDRTGSVWMTTWDQGIWRVKPNGEFILYRFPWSGKLHESVRAVFEDREGNIWLGTEASGLIRLRRRLFETMGAESGLRGGFIRSVTKDSKDNVYVADYGGADRIEMAGGVRIVSPMANIPLSWTIYCDSKDRLWAGTYGGELSMYENGRERQFFGAGGAKLTAIVSFLEVNGTMLVGTTKGLWQVRGEELVKMPLPIDPEAEQDRALAVNSRGTLFVGMGGGGLWQCEGGKWSQVKAADFAENEIRALHADGDGALWAASYERGLYRIKEGDAFRFDPETTGMPRQVTSITEDKSGRLWLGSMQGITSISKGDLNLYADGDLETITPIRYTTTDGLRTLECTAGHQPLACQTSDGRIWFGTVNGLSVVSPAALTPNSVASTVLIEEAQIWKRGAAGRNDAPVTVDRPLRNEAIVVPPGSRRVELHYTALSFSAPERVKFRYRVEGLDFDWTDAGTRRVAYFQGLPPGSYKFHVIACNNDGVWNETGAVAALTVLPRFSETRSFKAILIFLIVAGAWTAYRMRMARLKSVNELRLRIARDLHDEIGANLGSIGLNTDLLIHDPQITDEQRQDLSEIRGVTSQTAQSVRDIVWFTNPNFDNTTGMVRRMREVATLLLAGRKVRFDVSDDPGTALRLEFRRNVFSIFKEALHNIVKHSNATEAQIDVILRGDGMEMTISDNGRGFDPNSVSSNGVLNLRRRAEEIGGALEIVSKPDRGTRITLKAPFKRRHSLTNWFPRTRD